MFTYITPPEVIRKNVLPNIFKLIFIEKIHIELAVDSQLSSVDDIPRSSDIIIISRSVTTDLWNKNAADWNCLLSLMVEH